MVSKWKFHKPETARPRVSTTAPISGLRSVRGDLTSHTLTGQHQRTCASAQAILSHRSIRKNGQATGKSSVMVICLKTSVPSRRLCHGKLTEGTLESTGYDRDLSFRDL